jgi:probable H4MPT-linked C1 transfer pathway protein
MAHVDTVVGWDIGGAHTKACLIHGGAIVDVAQWPCALWRGLHELDDALDAAMARWPRLLDNAAQTVHAVTMSGEMVDLFATREEGVQRITAKLAQRLPGHVALYGGRAGWFDVEEADARWPQIASANWFATADHAARLFGDGVLVDIGSTTVDLVAFRDGRVASDSNSDHDRLRLGELVYSGVIRTPLCALSRRVPFRGAEVNVMAEWFATTADVYRLTGELDPAHDQHPSADAQAKDLPGSRQRLARMIGLDARDASDSDWLALARHWRALQINEIAQQLGQLMAQVAKNRGPWDKAPTPWVAISAGCGSFLVDEVVAAVSVSLSGSRAQASMRSYGEAIAKADGAATANATDARARRAWAQVCAPSVAVAHLWSLTGVR